jgi:hypothetical protein
MKKNFFAMLLLGFALSTAFTSAETAPAMPRIFANARFVYVTAYDGGQFDPNLLPEDRAAIAQVQEAIQKWAS